MLKNATKVFLAEVFPWTQLGKLATFLGVLACYSEDPLF